MQVYCFHLMPWAYLPENFSQAYHTAWVVCPNTLYDPELGHPLYNRYLDELELADQLGFDGVCVNEHHQTAYGLMPSPNIMAACLARRTSQARLVILGNEFFSYNVNPTYARERFHEAHDLILKAWTQPGPFTWEGTHYRFRYVNV